MLNKKIYYERHILLQRTLNGFLGLKVGKVDDGKCLQNI